MEQIKPSIRFHPQGRAEHRNAANAARAYGAKIGFKFLRIFREMAEHYADFPDSAKKAVGRFKYYPIRTFPYYVFYAIIPGGIMIAGLCHTSRSQKAWREMLKNR